MTDERKSKMWLEESDIGIEDFLTNLPGGVAVYKMGKEIETLYSSEGVPKLSGRTMEEYKEWVKGDVIFNTVYENDIPKMKRELDKHVPKGEPINITYRLKHKDGGLVWVQLSANKIEERDGAFIYYAVYTKSIEEAALYQSVVDDSSTGVIIAEAEGRKILFVNRAWREILMVDPNLNIVGMGVVDVFNNQALMTAEEIANLPSDGYRDFYKTTPEGKYLHVSGRSFVWNGIASYVCYVSDETAMMKVQQHIEQRYEYELQMRNELLGDAIIYYQINISQMRIEEEKVMTNEVEVYKEPLKFNKDIWNGIVEKYVAEEFQEEFKRKFRISRLKKAFENDITSIKLSHFRLKDFVGDKWCSIETSLMQRPETGDVIAMMYVRDIDETYKIEMAINEIVDEEIEYVALLSAKDGQAFLIKASPDGFLLPNKDEFDFDEFGRMIMRAVISDDDLEGCKEFFNHKTLVEKLETSPDVVVNFSCNQADGKLHRKKTRAFYLDNTKKEIILVRRDVTDTYLGEREKAEALRRALIQAQEASSAKSSFLSRVSHDMRTPLNGILGLTHLMREKSSWESIQEDLTQLEMSGQYLLNLINDTLDVSKIENGKMELHPTVCDGKNIIQSVIGMLNPNIEEKGIKFSLKSDEIPFTMLYIDIARLEQLVVNVLGNAIKFTPEGGSIECKLENLYEDDNKLIDKFTVKDNGIGMSQEFLPHLFEPFSQEDNRRTSKYQGTGLGMTISKQIVELMGGEISVKSKVGEGTEFAFTMVLPKATKEQCDRVSFVAEQDVDLSILKGKKVLVCEDHSLNIQIITRLLERHQMKVDIAHNGSEGVTMFQRSEPGYYDCILMDIRMPVMDGLTATKLIRAMDRRDGKTIPIFAMTANALSDDIEESAKVGMNAHLSKPLTPKNLYETIAKYIK